MTSKMQTLSKMKTTSKIKLTSNEEYDFENIDNLYDADNLKT